MLDEFSIRFDESSYLEEGIENKISMVGLLVADHEPPHSVVKDVLRAIWGNMSVVKVLHAKKNVYSITVGEEEDARRLMEGNPWFIKGNTFTIKPWPNYILLDEIMLDRAIF